MWKQTPANQDHNRVIWEEELDAFVPQRIFDVHTHVWDDTTIPPGETFSCAGHPIRSYQVPELANDLAALLPGRTIRAVCFGFPNPDYDLAGNNAYVARACPAHDFTPFRLLDPHRDTPDSLLRDVVSFGYRGLKPYPDYVRGDLTQTTIHQMLPGWAMQIADELRLTIMLHIPRPGRLADPVNQEQIVELCTRYPNAKVILAHVGRAYYVKGVIGQLEHLKHLPNLYYDLAMVSNWEVIEHLFATVPGGRVLFGSDMPFAIAPGKSVEINNQYTYVTPVPWKLSICAGDRILFTSFLYEQLRAIKRAVERLSLSRTFVEDLFHSNASRLLA